MPNLLTSIKAEKSRINYDKIGVRTHLGDDGLPVIESHPTDQIKSLEDLLKVSAVDLDKFEVTKYEANAWHQNSVKGGLIPLHQVKAFLKRRDLTQECIREIFEKGWKAFKKGLAFPKGKMAKPEKCGRGKLAVYALPDLHLGKLAWGEETGHGNWDTKTAEDAYNEAIDDLIMRGHPAEEGWLVVGNDFFNVDNDQRLTTAGTPQDEDGRWQKTFVKGQELITGAVGRLRAKHAKVRVIVVLGNHDKQRSFYLGRALEAEFRGVKGIDIDNRVVYRKFYQWGATGFGFAHGDRLKVKDLAALCQNEAREIWGRTKRFELHLGHLHQDIVKTLGGVIIRWLPALCPPDAWHAAQGYTMSEKAAMLLEYDQKGMQQQLVHYPRPELFLD